MITADSHTTTLATKLRELATALEGSQHPVQLAQIANEIERVGGVVTRKAYLEMGRAEAHDTRPRM